MSDEARERAEEEVKRLSILTPESSETNIIRTYLDWLCDLPWNKTTEDVLDLKNEKSLIKLSEFFKKINSNLNINFNALKYILLEQQPKKTDNNIKNNYINF